MALALAHARFAVAHPNLHALAWGHYVAKADAADLQQEASECFSVLRETVAAACLLAGSSDQPAAVAAWACW